jgi:hypothetical protein
MTTFLLILVFVFQGDASSPKWDCVKDFEPPDKNVTRLEEREMVERLVRCKTPKLQPLFRANGSVLVEVFVKETGDVACLRPIRSTPLAFVRPALDAAKKWKFKPLVVKGKSKSYAGLIYVYVSWDVNEMKKRCPKH